MGAAENALHEESTKSEVIDLYLRSLDKCHELEGRIKELESPTLTHNFEELGEALTQLRVEAKRVLAHWVIGVTKWMGP